MYETDLDKAHQVQSDVLLEPTKDNPIFVKSGVAARNKALKTQNTQIVGAINEILDNQDTLSESVKSTIMGMASAVGDVGSSKELADKLKEVDINLVEAVYKMNNNMKKLDGRISRPVKDIVFVVPKLTQNTKMPEIYFPYQGFISKVTASVSSLNANRNDEDAAINFEVQYCKDNTWTTLTSGVIEKGKTYMTKNILEENNIVDNKPMRIKINSLPVTGETTDMSVIVSMTVQEQKIY